MPLAKSQIFDGDFLTPSFHENATTSATAFSPYYANAYEPSSTSLREDCRDMGLAYDNQPSSRVSCLGQKSKRYKLISALKDKIISDNVSNMNSARNIQSKNENLSLTSSPSNSQLDEDEDDEEKTFRNEMYNNACVIDSLKEKYVCLNFEFNELQERHDQYLGDQSQQLIKDEEEAMYSDSSENTLERKFTQVFHFQKPSEDHSPKPRNPSKKFKNQKKEERKMEDKENVPTCHHNNKELKMILRTLKKIFQSPPKTPRDQSELKKLYELVKSLQDEQEKFRSIIKEQQDQLSKFHSKYIQAQDIIQSQKCEINELYHANAQLETELNKNMNDLKEKFQTKIKEIAQLPRAVKAEKSKCEKLTRENCNLISKIQQMKQELVIARAKLEETCQKRSKVLNKLKLAERDLKIFRTQNNTLKAEKRTLYEEMRKLKGENDNLKSTSTKSISRQKERGESQQRLLRKKIIDLEMELDRSRNSTNVLVEERDKLIAELHMQLNTLVHNFEISQKHIRILRRHIYSLSGSQIPSEKIA